MPVEFGTVTSKGQVVIPVELRRKLRIKAGTRVAFHEERGQLIIQPITDEFIDSLRGILGDTSDMIEQLRRDHATEDK
jgi:AbrB family looped-hinge helix DNA binding protein